MFSAQHQAEFRLKLQNEFSRRCRVNERYSLRALAKQAGLDPSTLSQILAGKRKVSERMIERILQKLDLDVNVPPSTDNYYLLQQDAFNVIADWFHLAILDLTLLSNFNSNPIWIARKLGITQLEAKTAVARLIRIGMLEENRGVLSKSKAKFTNYREGTTSAAHKEYQRQIIQKALHALENCRAELKDITSMTIAASVEKLPAAKEKIKRFRRQLCHFLEDGKKDSVYHLAIQLYPVTEMEKEEK